MAEITCTRNLPTNHPATRRAVLAGAPAAAAVVALPAGGAMALPASGEAHPTPIERLYEQWLETLAVTHLEINRYAIAEHPDPSEEEESFRCLDTLYAIGRRIATAPPVAVEDVIIKLQLVESEFEYCIEEDEIMMVAGMRTALDYLRTQASVPVPPVPPYQRMSAAEIAARSATA